LLQLRGAALHKLPVVETAGRACQFVLRDAGTILRLSWFPLLVVTIVQYFAMRAQFSAMRSAFESGNVNALNTFSPLWHWQIVNAIATFVGTAIVAVALHRVILLGDRKPGRWIHIAFGKVELLFTLLPIIFLVPVLIAAVLIVGLSAAVLPKSAGVLVFVALVVKWAGLIFIFLRLELVLPLAVIEGRYNFTESWSLTRGNFWRIVGLWLLVLIPFALVAALISAATSPFAGLSAGQPKTIAAIFERFESLLLVQSAFGFVWSVVGGALSVAVLSYSYKALSGIDPDAVWTP
jgi:hypothetical protein